MSTSSHERIGPFEGAVGVQTVDFDSRPQGEEAFLPDTTTRKSRVSSTRSTNRSVAVAVRRTLRQHAGDGRRGRGVRSRRSPARSTRAAARSARIWSFAEGYALAGSCVYTQRPPNYQELFADGPHVGTGLFEVGDRDLGVEKSSGIDVALRRAGDGLDRAASARSTTGSNYIALFHHRRGRRRPSDLRLRADASRVLRRRARGSRRARARGRRRLGSRPAGRLAARAPTRTAASHCRASRRCASAAARLRRGALGRAPRRAARAGAGPCRPE